MTQTGTPQQGGDAIRVPEKLAVSLIVNGTERQLNFAPWTTFETRAEIGPGSLSQMPRQSRLPCSSTTQIAVVF